MCVARGNLDLSKSKQKIKETHSGKFIQFAIIGIGSRDRTSVPVHKDRGPGPGPRCFTYAAVGGACIRFNALLRGLTVSGFLKNLLSVKGKEILLNTV